MWRRCSGLVLAMLCLQNAPAQERFLKQDFPSNFLGGNRTVRIYLPASYSRQPERRYPVLYLHDGQNVFSFAGTNVAFGWGSWELDKTADLLAAQGRMEEVLLVAVDNSPARYVEYCGAHHTAGTNRNTPFENYTAFLVKELKPKIDQTYRTRPDPANTGVMGSSMGGICSLILAWEQPEVFGLAASLSGAFMVERSNFLDHVLREWTGPPKACRLYLDSGVTDFMRGDDGCKLTKAVASELQRIGWRTVEPVNSLEQPAPSPGKASNWGDSLLMHYVDAKPLTPEELEKKELRHDKWAEAQTSQHNEFYWRLRAWRPFTFLFPAKP